MRTVSRIWLCVYYLKKLIFRKKVLWLKWDSNPRPKTSALNWRLRPLGHPATCWLQKMTDEEKKWIYTAILMFMTTNYKITITASQSKGQQQLKPMPLNTHTQQWKMTFHVSDIYIRQTLLLYLSKLTSSFSLVCINTLSNRFQLCCTSNKKVFPTPYEHKQRNQQKNEKKRFYDCSYPAVSNGKNELEDWKNVGVSVTSDWARLKALKYHK